MYHNAKKVGYDADICYWGANHIPSETPIFRKEYHTKILLEIRFYEILELPISLRNIYHPYSDNHEIESLCPYYSVEEILSEKLRALLQRNRGKVRDYFDIWYMKNNIEIIDWKLVKEVFKIKCDYKGIMFKSVEDFFQEKRMKRVDITWEARLAYQLPFVVEKNLVIKETNSFLNSLFL